MKLEDHFKYGPFKKKSILLVDDEEDLGWILRKVIRDAGHKLVCAITAKEGLKMFERIRNLDIAIVDLRLDNESGLTFIRTAKKMKKPVKFIMISAFGTLSIKEKAKRLGVQHFLDKPIKIESLLEVINQ